jgi:hypothetical protein
MFLIKILAQTGLKSMVSNSLLDIVERPILMLKDLKCKRCSATMLLWSMSRHESINPANAATRLSECSC